MESTEINKILDTIVPGHESLNDEIYFEPLSMSGLKEMHEYSIDKRLYEEFKLKSKDLEKLIERKQSLIQSMD